MKKTRAQDVLPEKLLAQIQQYVQGCTLYIPKKAGERRAWGEGTGSRKELAQRNERMRREYRAGARIEALADAYCLTPDSVRKIVRGAAGKAGQRSL